MFLALATSASADDAAILLQGVWGWNFSDDMTCAANPHQITYDPASRRLKLKWRTPVIYSDGTSSSGDEFEIDAVTSSRVETMRLRDGFRGVFVLSPDGKTYAFDAAKPNTDPSFEFPYVRCEFISS